MSGDRGPGSAAERWPASWEAAQALIASRQNISAKRLVAPGPDAGQLHAMLSLAAAAPDHGQLTPWRFVVVPAEQRERLAEVFSRALLDRDPAATAEQLRSAHEKAHRAPLLLVVVARLGASEPDIPPLERMVAVGAAVQNVLLGAHALGFGAGLTSGQAMRSPRLHALLQLAQGEAPVCCINVGTVSQRKPASRVRPDPAAFTRTL